ncbi:hypothetical protein KV557_41225 [Kitasatospora aureofaciens]|uniref:hypothetical protein n=1 Tax=Kitasatospora aureofaciens TaxID=1894 RepID=UPI001C48A9C1|nr:hypothetical protein [Kitasatospora aureofaciens]MBV6703427.1 hypothetical protein [Kitasatospora aureofaciens]
MTPTWRGLNFVDGLAATYPQVIDYYLHGGRERVESAVSDLTKLLRLHTTSAHDAEVLEAADATATLTALAERVNAEDPHYSYDLMITHDPVDMENLDQHRLAVVVQQQTARFWVTIAVRARFEDAEAVRPRRYEWTLSPFSLGS